MNSFTHDLSTNSQKAHELALILEEVETCRERKRRGDTGLLPEAVS